MAMNTSQVLDDPEGFNDRADPEPSRRSYKDFSAQKTQVTNFGIQVEQKAPEPAPFIDQNPFTNNQIEENSFYEP